MRYSVCACVVGRRSKTLGGLVLGMRRQEAVADRYQAGRGDVQGHREPGTERL